MHETRDRPLSFSLIIPTMNEAQDIAATIQACLALTHLHKEIIVVEDSTDETPRSRRDGDPPRAQRQRQLRRAKSGHAAGHGGRGRVLGRQLEADMTWAGTVTMSTDELDRLVERRLTQRQAAEQLGVSERQVGASSGPAARRVGAQQAFSAHTRRLNALRGGG